MEITKRFRKIIFKSVIYFILSFPLMVFLNTGFLIDNYLKIIQPAIFGVVITIIIFNKKVRSYIFIVSLILIIIMAILYVLKLIFLAEIFGSTALGLVMINLISYLPQLTKLGYIKRL